jgi:inner membrane protein
MFGAEFWWAIFGLLLIFSELLLPGVILMFFGFGALVTALVAWVTPASLNLQIIVFSVASVASLVLMRKYLKKMFSGRAAVADSVMQDGVIGQRAVVEEAIESGRAGKVKLHGAAWSAESDENLEVGAVVEVIEQKSLVLIVKRK